MNTSDIPLLAYLAVGVGLIRLGIRAVRHAMVDPFSLPADWSDAVGCLFFGAVVAFAWPVWIVPALIARMPWRRADSADDFIRFVGGESKREKLKRQEARIAELERELDIR